VPRGETSSGLFNADDWVAPKDQRKMDEFILFGLTAATQAVEDSGWKPTADEDRERTGVLIGSGIGGLQTIYETSKILIEKGPRRVSPFFIPASLINLVSGQVSIKYGFKGPNHSVVTACSTGAHAIGDASRLIQLGDADVMVAGGAEAAICRLGMAGFAAALLAAFVAVLGMLGLNGLPMPYHPVFNVPRFVNASRNRFFLCIESRDRKFDQKATAEFLESLGPREVTEVAY